MILIWQCWVWGWIRSSMTISLTGAWPTCPQVQVSPRNASLHLFASGIYLYTTVHLLLKNTLVHASEQMLSKESTFPSFAVVLTVTLSKSMWLARTWLSDPAQGWDLTRKQPLTTVRRPRSTPQPKTPHWGKQTLCVFRGTIYWATCKCTRNLKLPFTVWLGGCQCRRSLLNN